MMSDQELFDYLVDLATKAREALRDAEEIEGKFYPAFDGCRATRLLDLARPDMPSIFNAKCLNRDGLRARHLLETRWEAIEAASQDPLLETLEAMAPFVDEGWDGVSTYSPSELMIMRYFIAVSDRENPERRSRMQDQARGWISEARRRWRAGFYANPLGQPRQRAV